MDDKFTLYNEYAILHSETLLLTQTHPFDTKRAEEHRAALLDMCSRAHASGNLHVAAWGRLDMDDLNSLTHIAAARS